MILKDYCITEIQNDENSEETRNQILDVFERYKDFVNCHDLPMPNIDLQTMTERKSRYKNGFSNPAGLLWPKDSSNVCTLHTFNGLFTEFERIAEVIIAHELTHAYHWHKFSPLFEIENTTQYLSNYSEFHASYIQLLNGANFQSATTEEKISLSDKIYALLTDHFDSIELSGYLGASKRSLKPNIDFSFGIFGHKGITNGFQLLFDSLFRSAMNHFSLIYFLEKHCTDDFSALIGATAYTDIFGSDILEYVELIKSDTITKDTLLQAKALETSIKDKFISKYGG